MWTVLSYTKPNACISEGILVETESIITQDLTTISEAPMAVMDTDGADTVTTIMPVVTKAETSLQGEGYA